MIEKPRTVRRCPRTGLGHHIRKSGGVIYLPTEWRKEKVVVLRYHQYRTLIFQAKAKELRLKVQILQDKLDRIRKVAK